MEEDLFRSIPRVDELLGRDELKVSALPPVLLRESVREELDALRDEVRGGLSALPETGILCARILARAEEKQLPTLRSVINATGVTLHTNLGRACLSERAANAVVGVSGGNGGHPLRVQPAGKLVFIERTRRRRRNDDKGLRKRQGAAQHLLPVLVAQNAREEDELLVPVERGPRTGDCARRPR